MSSIFAGMRRSQSLQPIIALSIAFASAACVAFAADEFVDSGEGAIQPLIVGGTVAGLNEYPWMCALTRSSDPNDAAASQFCGAMLIAPYWALTAGHCVDGELEEIHVTFSNGDLSQASRTIRVTKIFSHPGFYSRVGQGQDIALLQLAEPVLDREPIGIIDDPALPFEHSAGLIIGWGRNSYEIGNFSRSERLQEAAVSIYDLESMRSSDWRSGNFEDDAVVVGDAVPLRGAFSGDSGGPLLIDDGDGNWAVAGIASFGSGGACFPEFQHLTVYANAGMYYDWIEDIALNSSWDPSAEEILASKSLEIIDHAPESGRSRIGYRLRPFASNFRQTIRVVDEVGRFAFGKPLSFQPYDLSFGANFVGEPEEAVFYEMDLQLQPFLSIEAIVDEFAPMGPIRIEPFQNFRGVMPPRHVDGVTEHYALRLTNFEPDIHYQVRHAGAHEIVAERNGNWVRLGSNDFTASKGDDIWIFLLSPFSFEEEVDFEVFPLLSSGNARSSPPYSGELTEEDHPYREEGIRVDILDFANPPSGEVMIELHSDFDAELSIHDRTTGALKGTHDRNGSADTEYFIFDGSDLERIRIFNFEPNDFGAYTLEYDSHADANTYSVGDVDQRAITRSDSSFVQDDQRIQYYERIDLRNLNDFESVSLLLNGFGDFEPFGGLFDANDQAFFQRFQYDDCRRAWWVNFSPAGNRSYFIIAATIGEDTLNGNYQILSAAEEFPEEDDEVSRSRKFDSGNRLTGGPSMEYPEALLRKIGAQEFDRSANGASSRPN